MGKGILILDNDIGFEGMSAQWIKSIVTPFFDDIDIYQSRKGTFPPDPNGYDGMIISGSSSSVYDQENWITRLEDLVATSTIPTLGICFGHQMIAQAYNGKVERSGGYEVGWKGVELLPSKIFSDIPNQITQFEIHNDTVTELGAELEIIAKNSFGCQGIKVRDKEIYGFQFHPEIGFTESNYVLSNRRNRLQEVGINYSDCFSGYHKDKDYGVKILENFLEMIQ